MVSVIATSSGSATAYTRDRITNLRGKAMDIPIDVEVFCTDGLCGRSMRVVLKKDTEEVTHLVVRKEGSPHTELLVPVSAMTCTTPDSINLRYTNEELLNMQPFIKTEYLRVDVPRYDRGVQATLPRAHTEPNVVPVTHELVPPGEIAVGRGAPVMAIDGHVGRVDEFLVDPATQRISHLVLREGHLWGRREVTIPVSEIHHIEANAVHLNLNKRQVEALPSVKVRG